jgi:hypothetical protein
VTGFEGEEEKRGLMGKKERKIIFGWIKKNALLRKHTINKDYPLESLLENFFLYIINYDFDTVESNKLTKAQRDYLREI